MKRYIGLITFTVIAFGLAYILPTSEMLKGIYAMPSLLGLLGILYQILRDQSQHEKMEYLQRQQQVHQIGSASHMANVAFDKHVEFCEEYIQNIHETMNVLWREGPTEKAVALGNKLYSIRLKYSAWLTEEMGQQLFPFEQALRELGASQGFINQTIDSEQYAEQRSKLIWQVHSNIKKILNMDKDHEIEAEIEIESVKNKVRKILGINELVSLRNKIISDAMSSVNA